MSQVCATVKEDSFPGWHAGLKYHEDAPRKHTRKRR